MRRFVKLSAAEIGLLFKSASASDRSALLQELEQRKSAAARSVLSSLSTQVAQESQHQPQVDLRSAGRDFGQLPINVLPQSRHLRELHNRLIAKYDTERTAYLRKAQECEKQSQGPAELRVDLRVLWKEHLSLAMFRTELTQLSGTPRQFAATNPFAKIPQFQTQLQELERLTQELRAAKAGVSTIERRILANLDQIRAVEKPESKAADDSQDEVLKIRVEPYMRRLPEHGGEWSNCRRCGGSGGMDGRCPACGGNGFEQA